MAVNPFLLTVKNNFLSENVGAIHTAHSLSPPLTLLPSSIPPYILPPSIPGLQLSIPCSITASIPLLSSTYPALYLSLLPQSSFSLFPCSPQSRPAYLLLFLLLSLPLSPALYHPTSISIYLYPPAPSSSIPPSFAPILLPSFSPSICLQCFKS